MFRLRDNSLVTANGKEDTLKVIREAEWLTRYHTINGADVLYLIGETDTSLEYILTGKSFNEKELVTEFRTEKTLAGIMALANDMTATLVEISKTDVDEGLLREARETKLALLIDDEFFFASSHIFSDLVLVGIAGDMAYEPSLVWAYIIAQRINNKELTLCCRRVDGTEKLFAIRSKRYTPIDTATLYHIGETFKPFEEWNTKVTPFLTQIRMEAKAEGEEIASKYGITGVTPYIDLFSSNTGDSSITARAGFRIGKSFIIFDEVLAKHSSRFNASDFETKVKQKIFDRIETLPQALSELMMIEYSPISDMREIISSLFKQLKINSLLGKKTTENLMDLIVAEVNPETAYDLCIAIMTIPERLVGVNEVTLTDLAKLLSRTPYLKYHDEAEDIYLAG